MSIGPSFLDEVNNKDNFIFLLNMMRKNGLVLFGLFSLF